jgi:hypothetical protein
MSATGGLACVLLAEADATTEELYRMVKLPADEILQKPISKERLKNIWQYVVRKVRCNSKWYQDGLKAADAFLVGLDVDCALPEAFFFLSSVISFAGNVP